VSGLRTKKEADLQQAKTFPESLCFPAVGISWRFGQRPRGPRGSLLSLRNSYDTVCPLTTGRSALKAAVFLATAALGPGVQVLTLILICP